MLENKMSVLGLEAYQATRELGDFKSLRSKGSTLVEKIVNEFSGKGINIIWFGAVGDGIANDTIPLQSTVDYIYSKYGNRGGTIVVPEGYVFKIDIVTIKSKHITITGGGIIDGQILIKSVDEANSNSNNIKDLFTTIDNVKFISTNPSTDAAIKIHNTRCVNIKGCYFENYINGILGESIKYDVYYQQTARVRVMDCVFYDVDYCIKTTWTPWMESGSSKWVYHQHGDWQISNCQGYFYKRGITHLHFEGQDGLIITNNTLFHNSHQARSLVKEYNIYIKQSNFSVISNNNLFEAGLEAIRILDYRIFTLTDNNIAWCGQRAPSSAVFVETSDISNTHKTSSLSISNNQISGTTKNGIDIGNNPIRVKVANNNIFGVGTSYYYGESSIPIEISGVFVKENNTDLANKNTVIVENNFSDKEFLVRRGLERNNSKIGDFL